MKKFLIVCVLLLFFSSAYANENSELNNFYKAIKKGNIEYVRKNISEIEKINSPKCFLCAASQYKQNEILDILLENKADANCPLSSISPLYTAVYYENNYAIEKLLKAGADPNNKKNFPLFYLATVTGDTTAVKNLLEAGADENVKFMGMSAVKYTFLTDDIELQKVFINFWNKRFETPAVSIEETVKLLEPLKNGNKYYKILTGENPSKKPFEIIFCDINKINTGDFSKNDSYANIYYSSKKQNVIYMDNKYRNYPKEVLAALLAGESINIDGKNSVIELLVTMGVAADVWKELVSINPKINDETIPAIKSFNAVNKIMETNNAIFKAGDYNNLWAFSGLCRGLKKKSKGFKNENLNIYF